MRGDNCVAVSLYCDNAVANPAIPVFSFSYNSCLSRFNLIFKPGNHICKIIPKPKIAAYAVYIHMSRMKLVQVFAGRSGRFRDEVWCQKNLTDSH